MITRNEIITISKKENVPASTIDKDYVLGHQLNVIFSETYAKDLFIFKGGNCLRKCYFENYRFSEGIDITVLDIDFDYNKNQFQKILNAISDQTGILYNIFSFEIALYNDQKVGWDIEICYWGANHSKNEIPRFGKECHSKISLDIRTYEYLHFRDEIENKIIIHPYSDKDLITARIPAYSIHEILSEKLRAILQRKWGEARDYYDLWYLSNHSNNIDWKKVRSAFQIKCDFKSIKYNCIDDFFKPERLNQVNASWEARLKHQLSSSVEKDKVVFELKDILFPSIFS